MKISVIIPVYNEHEVLPELLSRLKTVLSHLSADYEIIFVDDGSSDSSAQIITLAHETDDNIKLIQFSRNFGHQTAVSAGIDFSTGDCVIIMDADLQDPPEFIATLLQYWKNDYQVVYAIRKKRKEGIFKRLAYKAFYRILRKLSDIDIPLDTGDFCLMDQTVVQHLKEMPERNRFVRGLRAWIGYRQIGIEYERDKRFAGEVKYTFSKLLKLAFDGLLSFSYVPLRLATLLGFTVSAFSFLCGLLVTVLRMTTDYVPQGWTSTLVIVFFLGGIQLITIGIIGEYIGRIHDEVKQRPLYIAKQLIGFKLNKN